MARMEINLDDLERSAKNCMEAGPFEYVASGAGDEHTLSANRSAFEGWNLLPHVLKDVHAIDTTVTLFGRQHSLPLLLAPTGYHRLVHPNGEYESIAGANLADCTMVASCFATEAFAKIQTLAKRPQWFQLYVQQDRGYTRELLQRVLHAGCEAVCVTVDLAVNSSRDRESRVGFALPKGVERANLTGLSADLAQTPRAGNGPGIYNPTRAADLTWKDIDWLRRECTVPLLLKGILRADDAQTAHRCGCDGVIVSNHGGRALDSVPATLAVLPGIVEAVGDEMTVLMDGGIRRGTDIVKALACGARAVLLGRPYLFGLAVDGADGMAHAVRLLRVELEVAMALLGCSSVAQLDRSVLVRR